VKLAADAHLSDDAAKLLADGPRFAKVCGTHYVSTERRGSSVSAVVSISGLSASEKQDISAEMNASGGWGPLSASAAAKFQQQLSKATQSGRTKIQVVATGGNGFAELGTVVARLSAGENSLPAIANELGEYMKQFNAENSARIGFHVRSMEDFGWDPKAVDLWSDVKNRRLLALTDEYRQISDLIESARGIAAGVDSRTKIVTEEQRRQIPVVINNLEAYLSQLASVHTTCKEATPKQATDRACKVPTEPEGIAKVIPDLPAPANGTFRVAVTKAGENPDVWDSVISRPVVYDRPRVPDRTLFLSGAGLLEAVRIQEPKATRAALIFTLTGDHVISATLKHRDVTGEPVIVGMVPLPGDHNVGVYSATQDQRNIKVSPDFLGRLLIDWLGTRALANGSEFYLDVRDRIGRTMVVPVARVSEGGLVWAR